MEQENKELLELKEQLAALHAKLDRQAEINDRTIKNALDASISEFRKLGNTKFWFCIIATIVLVAIVYILGLRLPLIIATGVFFALKAIDALILYNKEKGIDSGDSLMETMDKVLNYKKFNRVSTLVALPFAILWVGWYVYEVCFTLGLTEPKEVVFIGLAALTGGIIGGCIGYAKFYRPSMEEADNIIRQMKELKGE